MPTIFSRIIQFFNQPFQYIHKRWQVVLVSTIWVFLIGIILKPLGIELVMNKLQVILIFSIMTILEISFVMYGLPLIFRKFYNPNNWTIGKFLSIPLAIVLIIAPSASILTYLVCMQECIEITISFPKQLLIWYMRAAFIALFPTLTFYFLYKKPQQISVSPVVLTRYQDIQQKTTTSEAITLVGNTKESLEIIPEMLLYAEVLGNYVTIYYLHENVVKQKALRITLQQIMNTLDKFPQIIRCHRAFIVNISSITEVKGNSHGYRLNLKHLDTEIPVSKSYTKSFKKAFDSY